MDEIRRSRNKRRNKAFIQSLSAALLLIILLCLSAGIAGAIKVKPGKFNNFSLSVPDKIFAGESFVVRIKAQDSYGNLITDFSESGKEVTLSASGPATIHPVRLIPALFEGGVANVTVTARDAGNLSLFISNTSTGKKIQNFDILVDWTLRQTENSAGSLKDTSNAKGVKKTASRLPETAKKEAAAKLDRPAKKEMIKESVNEKKASTVVSKPRETQKTASPPPEPAKKIPENRKGENLFSISDISILEAGEKALLVIKSSSPSETPEYKKTVETRHGKKTVKLRIKPAVRKTDSIVKLQSDLISNINVEEDIKERDVINLYIELKDGQTFSDIVTQKDALIVMISSKKF